MNIEKLYQDYGVITAQQGDKHYKEGWTQTICPFCAGDSGYHLGFNNEKGYFNCWRCGFHSNSHTLSKLLKIPFRKINEILIEYGGSLKRKGTHVKKVSPKKKALKIPKLQEILNSIKPTKYMKDRGFLIPDIRKLIKTYKISYTGYLNKIDNIDLSFRIFAPITYEDRIVTWQTRDISGKNPLKYLACPKAREKVHHKDILYYPPNTDIVILVEGIFDVWKIYLAGYPVTCGFGVELKPAQILLLKQYKKVILFLDPDQAGSNKSRNLFSSLCFAGVEVLEIINLTGKDAGDMSKKEIRKILNKLDTFYNEY